MRRVAGNTYTPNGSDGCPASATTRLPSSRRPSWPSATAALMSKLLGDNIDRVEVVGRELCGGSGVEPLAGIDVDAKEQHWFLPCIEMGAGALPVDPSGPAVRIRTVRCRLHQCFHATH